MLAVGLLHLQSICLLYCPNAGSDYWLLAKLSINGREHAPANGDVHEALPRALFEKDQPQDVEMGASPRTGNGGSILHFFPLMIPR